MYSITLALDTYTVYFSDVLESDRSTGLAETVIHCEKTSIVVLFLVLLCFFCLGFFLRKFKDPHIYPQLYRLYLRREKAALKM